MAFRDILGHSRQIETFSQRIRDGELAHAYLFYGPSGIGKELFARTLAKALNCEKGGGDCCDRCSVCQRIDSGAFPDCLTLRPSGASRTLKIEEIRELQKYLSFSSYEGKAKIAILVDAECLNQESSNALLKILEEPSPKTYFFLVSSNQEGLLATIRSRCHAVAFSPLPAKIVNELLEKKGIADPQTREILAKLSEGRMDRALQLQQEEGKSRRESLLKFVLSGKNSSSEALQIAEQMAKAAEEDKTVLWDLLTLLESAYRDLAAAKCGAAAASLLNPDWKEGIQKKCVELRLEEIADRIGLIERIRADLHRHTPAKFALDYLFLALSGKVTPEASRI